MTDRSMKRHRHGRVDEFGAPWGRTVKLMTALSGLVVVAGIVIPQLALSGRSEEAWARWLVPTILLVVFGVTSLFSVRGFVVTGRELWIHRLFWRTRFPLHELKQAYVDPGAMKGSIRLAGNGGFLAFTGWFRNKKLGIYRAFVTDPALCVVMEFKRRKILVSPENPEGFVRALGVQGGPKRNAG